MNQDWQLDGSVIITLTKRGDPRVYRLHVRNLYQAGEDIISDEVIERGLG